MPRGDGTGPDGKGPKSTNKGWPSRYPQGQGQGRGGGRGLRRRDGSCQQPAQPQNDSSEE
jgi:hypothetical protein